MVDLKKCARKKKAPMELYGNGSFLLLSTASTQIIDTMGRQWMMAVKVWFIFIYQKIFANSKHSVSLSSAVRTFAITIGRQCIYQFDFESLLMLRLVFCFISLTLLHLRWICAVRCGKDTLTHIPIDTCKCSLFRMQIRITVQYLSCCLFFLLWYCFS